MKKTSTSLWVCATGAEPVLWSTVHPTVKQRGAWYILLSMMRWGFWFGQLVDSGITYGEGEERIMLKLKFTCKMVGGCALWELREEMGLRLNIQQIFTKHLPFPQRWSLFLWRSQCVLCLCVYKKLPWHPQTWGQMINGITLIMNMSLFLGSFIECENRHHLLCYQMF